MSFGFKTVSGLYISENLISAAKFRMLGKTVSIVSCASQKGVFNSENIQQTIQSLLKKARISPYEIFVTSFMPNIIIKEIELPEMEEHLLGEALKYEIEHHIPNSLQDVEYGYCMQDIKVKDKSVVLAGIVKKDSFHNYINLFKQMNIKIKSFNIPPMALANYYSYVSPLILEKCVLVLDLNYSNRISINILDKGVLRFSKTIDLSMPVSVPTSDFVDPEWSKVLEEIDNSITYFQTVQEQKKPENICFHNDSGLLKDVKNFLVTRLGMSCLDISHIVEPDYVMPLGLALYGMDKGKSVELFANKKAITFFDKDLAENIFKLVIIAALVCAGFFANELFMRFKIKDFYKKMQEYQPDVAKVNQTKKNLIKLEKNILILKKNLEGNVDFLSVLSEIYTFVPENTCVLNIDIKSDGKIKMTVLLKDIDKFIVNLKGSAFLKNIRLVNINKSSEYNNGMQAAVVESVWEG
ncbi:pilus assembly protein PilM [bacterium]|nr:pilus assembly protein PilM [bacterium]